MPTERSLGLTRVCRQCGEEFHPFVRYSKERGRYESVFCGPECWKAWRGCQPVACRHVDNLLKWAKKGRKRYSYKPVICPCGRPGYRKKKRQAPSKYCSDRCKLAAHRKFRDCPRCGSEFSYPPSADRKNSNPKRFCSRRCWDQWNRENRIPRICRGCGDPITHKMRHSRVFCSRQCYLDSNGFQKFPAPAERDFGYMRGAAAHNAKKRGAAVIDKTVDPFAVFERAGWKCQCCGDPTPLELIGTIEPKGPNLDHIWPLAHGGTHTWDNVQLLCRECNMAKSDKKPDDPLQLSMFSL